MNLSLRRFRQISATILTRQFVANIKLQRLWSWHARTISSFIAASIPLEEGQENPLLPEVSKIALDKWERLELAEAAGIPTPSQDLNKTGSFERLMSGLRG